MSKHTVKTLAPFCYDGMEVAITFEYRPGRPARIYLRNGDPGYPADPAEVDFISAEVAGVTLPDALQKDLDDWCGDWLADDEGHDAALDVVEDAEDRAREFAAELKEDNR